MRIVGGTARGRTLEAPPGKGTRPTADRVRETLFNILGQRLEGEIVLDLYAGSGALALESLSRGAVRAVLVEKDRESARVCRRNLEKLGFSGRAQLLEDDALTALARLAPARFSLVFLDPPYALGPSLALERLGQGALLLPGARVVAEHDRRESPPERIGALVREDARRFGDTTLSFFVFEGASTENA